MGNLYRDDVPTLKQLASAVALLQSREQGGSAGTPSAQLEGRVTANADAIADLRTDLADKADASALAGLLTVSNADNRYYTRALLNLRFAGTVSTGLATKTALANGLATKAGNNHNHDQRYLRQGTGDSSYLTRMAMDTRYAPASHTHSQSQITNLINQLRTYLTRNAGDLRYLQQGTGGSSYLTRNALDLRYYTKTAAQTWADRRYYTRTAANTWGDGRYYRQVYGTGPHGIGPGGGGGVPNAAVIGLSNLLAAKANRSHTHTLARSTQTTTNASATSGAASATHTHIVNIVFPGTLTNSPFRTGSPSTTLQVAGRTHNHSYTRADSAAGS